MLKFTNIQTPILKKVDNKILFSICYIQEIPITKAQNSVRL